MPIINDTNIADSKDQEQTLKGIQPRHQIAFRFFKSCRLIAIILAILAVVAFILTKFEGLYKITANPFYRWGDVLVGLIAVTCAVLAMITRVLLLRKPPHDDWVYDIASKRLGTSIIFYDSKRLYINFDRSGKEVDKKEFVTEMSDKSEHFSYFYVKTDIDQGYIVVECKQRAPIPSKASFSPEDDKYWNIFPLGLTLHPIRQKIAPIGWYINDQNKNEDLLETMASNSILIAGGTGCLAPDTPVPVYDTLIH